MRNSMNYLTGATWYWIFIGIFNHTGIWCCAVTSVFGLHYSITTSGPHVIYAIIFARWCHCARLCDTWLLGSHESTPNGVCMTFRWFSCFTTAAHRFIHRIRHVAPLCTVMWRISWPKCAYWCHLANTTECICNWILICKPNIQVTAQH